MAARTHKRQVPPPRKSPARHARQVGILNMQTSRDPSRKSPARIRTRIPSTAFGTFEYAAPRWVPMFSTFERYEAASMSSLVAHRRRLREPRDEGSRKVTTTTDAGGGVRSLRALSLRAPHSYVQIRFRVPFDCLSFFIRRGARALSHTQAGFLANAPRILNMWAARVIVNISFSERTHAPLSSDLVSAGRASGLAATADRMYCRQCIHRGTHREGRA